MVSIEFRDKMDALSSEAKALGYGFLALVGIEGDDEYHIAAAGEYEHLYKMAAGACSDLTAEAIKQCEDETDSQ